MIPIAGSDARLLIRSAVPTAIAGAVAVAAGALVAGGRGLFGALLAVVVVALFFTISVAVVGWVSRVRPAALMPAALGTFLGKILLLLLMIAALRGTAVVNTKVFGFTAIACVLVWSAGQIAALARPMPYVEPAKNGAAGEEPGAAGQAPAAGGPAAGAGARSAPGARTAELSVPDARGAGGDR